MDFPAERLVRSIQVRDARVSFEGSDDPKKIKLTFFDRASLFIEVKVQPRDISRRELEFYWKELMDAGTNGQRLREVWHFNIESPGLTILSVSRDGLPQRVDLEPLDVWEFNDHGSVFDRSTVIARVEDWLRRIDDLYAELQGWAKRAGLMADRARTIRISEELMQKFAVSDRDVAILDLSRGDTPVMSVVPVGLWTIGSNGRVDLIMPDRTSTPLRSWRHRTGSTSCAERIGRSAPGARTHSGSLPIRMPCHPGVPCRARLSPGRTLAFVSVRGSKG